MEYHLLRGDAVLGSTLGRPLAAIHSKVPGRQVNLTTDVGHTFERVLKVWIVAKGTEVLAAIVVMVFDDLRLLLGDVARFGASLLLQPLFSWEGCLFSVLGLRVEEQEVKLIMSMVDDPVHALDGRETTGKR